MIRLSEKDFNLTEMFLKSHDRSSMNLNWSSAGALLHNIGDLADGDDSTAKSGRARSAANLLATPSSTTKPPVPLAVHVPSYSLDHESDATASTEMGDLKGTPVHPENRQQYYPYRRSLPLPITKRLSPEISPAKQGDNSEQSMSMAATDEAMAAALDMAEKPHGHNLVHGRLQGPTVLA